MAKLKARGREEVFRVERSRPSESEGVAEVRDFRALVSDGSVLERMVLHYTAEEVARNYGKKSHDYGWKVRGRAKSGLSLEQLLKSYLDRGWSLVTASGSYFTVSGDVVEAHSQEPFIKVEAAEKRRASLATQRTRSASAREERRRSSDGPGYYVTNGFTDSAARDRVADHPAPFTDLEQATEFAARRYQYFRRNAFNYLLPVTVTLSQSRRDAEEGAGDVLWVNGTQKGPPVDERQVGFGF